MRIICEKLLEFSDAVYAKFVKAAGLSTEEKPTKGIATGSLFLEVDTGDVYAFDEVGNTWNQIETHGADEAAIAEAVGAWLEDNVDPSTGYVIDNSLTVANAAADAKKTGDEISDLKSAIDAYMIETALPQDKWESGSLTAADATPMNTGTRIRTKTYIDSSIVSVVPASGYKLSLYAWSVANGTYVGVWNGTTFVKATGTSNWTTSGWNLSTFNGQYRFRLLLGKVGDANVTTADYINLTAQYPTDVSLSQAGKIADAKAVGEVKSKLDSIITGDAFPFAINSGWSQGGVNTSGEYESWSRIRTGFIDVGVLGKVTLTATTGYVFMCIIYDSAQTNPRTNGSWVNSGEITLGENEKYIRIQLRTEPEANLYPSAGSNLSATAVFRVTTAISEAKDEVDDCNSMTPLDFMRDAAWQLGTLDGNGDPSSTNATIRTKDFIDVTHNPYLYFSVDTGYKYAAYLYDSEYGYLGGAFGSWQTTARTLKIDDGTAYIKVTLSHDPAENMSDTSISQHLHVKADTMLVGTVNKLSEEVTEIKGVNILNGVEWERGVFDADGQPVESTSRIITSDFINISGISAILFEIKSGYKYSAYAYDSEENKIETTGWLYASNIYMVPPTASYIKLMMACEPDAWLANASISKNLTGYDKSEYTGLSSGATNGNLEELNWFNATAVNKLEIPALDSNTTILALGDSITAAQDETGWVYHFRNMTGCTVNDRAIGGTSYGESATSDSGHWMMTQIGNVPAAMWESADLVIMSCGTNDYGHGTPLAELKTKVQECITAIKAKTNVPIVVITPIRRGTGLNSDPMLKLPVFAGIISNVALANQCNVICGYDIPLPAYATGYVDSMTQDNLHPNATGANVFARAVINALM